MTPATTKGGGMCTAPVDVCKTPAPPAGPVPIPYPNFGQCASANGSTCSKKVKIQNKVVLTKKSELGRSSGDEAGTLKGVMSQTNMDKVGFKTGSTKVKVEGSEILMHLKPSAHNGSNANAPPGTHVAPSQMKVFIGS